MPVSASTQSRFATQSPVAAQVSDDPGDSRVPESGPHYRLEKPVRRVVRVAVPHGLHMRICAALVTACDRFEVDVTVQKGERMANAASILGLMLLGAMQGEHLQLSATARTPPRRSRHWPNCWAKTSRGDRCIHRPAELLKTGKMHGEIALALVPAAAAKAAPVLQTANQQQKPQPSSRIRKPLTCQPDVPDVALQRQPVAASPSGPPTTVCC